MENKIIYTNQGQLAEIMSNFGNPNYITVSLDGNEIKDRKKFYSAMEEKLFFPNSCNGIYARFSDWITDLSWIPGELGICIVIYHFSSFLSEDISFQSILMKDLEHNIIPFWSSKVKEIVKDGTTRSFFVIIVD